MMRGTDLEKSSSSQAKLACTFASVRVRHIFRMHPANNRSRVQRWLETLPARFASMGAAATTGFLGTFCLKTAPGHAGMRCGLMGICKKRSVKTEQHCGRAFPPSCPFPLSQRPRVETHRGENMSRVCQNPKPSGGGQSAVITVPNTEISRLPDGATHRRATGHFWRGLEHVPPYLVRLAGGNSPHWRRARVQRPGWAARL